MARCPHCSGASILESPNIFFSQTISVDKQMGKIPKISHVCLIFFSGSHIFYENKQINIQERGKCGKLGIAMPALPGQKISTWVCILGNRFTAPGIIQTAMEWVPLSRGSRCSLLRESRDKSNTKFQFYPFGHLAPPVSVPNHK